MSDPDLRLQSSEHSVLREQILEHLLIGELQRILWNVGNTGVEFLRSEYDRGGYDLVADNGRVVRHIQLKCSLSTAKSPKQTLSLNLAKKSSGCVVWVVVSPSLEIEHFLWFGSAPGLPLPDISGFRITKHNKGNAQGVKLERQNLRDVPKGKFEVVTDMESLLEKLFGPDWEGRGELLAEV